MILYGLTCTNHHGFEGWFSSSAEYDRQSEAGQVACPICQTRAVKAPMAPHIARHARTPAAERAPMPYATPASSVPDEAARMIGEFCKSVEANCDYVGKEFPEEARKIHYGETDVRGIYGEASRTEAEALKEEGIPVAPVPWVKKPDA